VILVDTAIWIDHLHRAESTLVGLLEQARVCIHPMIIGELALGSLRNRSGVLQLLEDLPGVPVATHAEVLHLVGTHRLHGLGLSLVDAHLLASLRLAGTHRLWTRDRRLSASARELRVVADLDVSS
jgi:predicted nucleic acid-binding protein